MGPFTPVCQCPAVFAECQSGQGQRSPPQALCYHYQLRVSTISLSFPSQDLARLQEGQPPEHRDVALQKVSDSEKLLYVLEADAAIAKHMKHPQGDMIAEE